MQQFSLEKYLQDPERKVVTREGKDVRIICTDREHHVYKVVALVKKGPYNITTEEVMWCSEKGRVYAEFEGEPPMPNPNDLFFAPKKETRWVFLHGRDLIEPSDAYVNKEAAEAKMQKINGFALTEITWEE